MNSFITEKSLSTMEQRQDLILWNTELQSTKSSLVQVHLEAATTTNPSFPRQNMIIQMKRSIFLAEGYLAIL